MDISEIDGGRLATLALRVFFTSRTRHTRFDCVWSSDVCSSDLMLADRLATNSCNGLDRVIEDLTRAIHVGNTLAGTSLPPVISGNPAADVRVTVVDIRATTAHYRRTGVDLRNHGQNLDRSFSPGQVDE